MIGAIHREQPPTKEQSPTKDKRKAVSSLEVQEEEEEEEDPAPPVVRKVKFTRPESINKPPPPPKTEVPFFESPEPTVRRKSTTEQESDLVKAFSKMSVDEQIYFVTPTSALGAVPPVNERTCKYLPCLFSSWPTSTPHISLFPAIVFANTDEPELNIGLEGVYPVQDLDGVDGKSWFHGFTVVQEIDIRWILDHKDDSEEPEPYKCRFVSHNCLEFTLPGPSYTLKNDRSVYEPFIPAPVLGSIDHDNHRLAEDASLVTGIPKNKRKSKKILLVFPDFVRLSAKEIYKHEDDEDKKELFPTAISHSYYHSLMGKTNNDKHYLLWSIARLDVGPYKRGKVEKKEKKSRLKAAFSSPPTKAHSGQSYHSSDRTVPMDVYSS